MGFHIKPVRSTAKDPAKRARTRTWKLQYFKEENGVRKYRDIPEGEYRVHGFLPSMTIEQAKSQKRLSNDRLKREVSAVKKVKAAARLTEREAVQFLYLNEDDVRDFEAQVLFRRLSRGDQGAQKRNKLVSHWNAVKDCLCAVKVDPSAWGDEYWKFYNHFAENQFSLAYLKKIIRVQNAWGAFIAKKHGKFFMPLPYPRGMDRAFIANAHHAKKKELKKQGRMVQDASAPLTSKLLKQTKGKFTRIENYEWLFISLWMGLRPDEVDRLKEDGQYRIEYDRKVKKQVLWVYQSKLVALKEDERWKAIPALYPEQSEALACIERGRFERPAPMTIRTHLGEEFSAYAGRKGFEDLMTNEKGHALEVVTEWLGHQSIETTWKNYRNRKRVRV